MRLQADLSQRMDQRLALLPRMLQSIEVLQLATVDLLALIDRELEENETLEVLPAVDEGTAPAERSAEAIYEGPPVRAGEEDRKLAMLNNLPAADDDLMEFIGLQLAWLELSDVMHDAVLLLAEHLDERGLLTLSDAELAVVFPTDPDLLEEALAVLQSLEPRGIGARSPIEAMLLQVRDDPDSRYIERLLTEHLGDLARNKLPDVAAALGLTVAEVRQLLERIRGLDPRPGAAFEPDSVGTIRPEAEVFLEDGVVQVAIDDVAVPALAINADYAAMLKNRSTAREVRDYLRGKVRSARGLIDAVVQRKETLARVVAAVMTHQRDFLEKGRAAIRPLRMSDLADRLAVHTSTVSRAIAGKYVQTDHGIFRLRDFFDGGRASSTGPASGRMAILAAIRELVDGEDKRRPLSDDELATMLATRGIEVARRTITKYRKELDIPSSWLRREHGNKP